MEKILSFDIGTRHLALCILQNEKENNTLNTKYTILDWRVIDLLAIKGTPYDDEMTFVESKGWKVPQLKEWLCKNKLSDMGKRNILLDRIHNDLKQKGIKNRKSNDINMLATKLFTFLDREPTFMDCDRVIFENQPCLLNPVMKSVQMILYSYFVYHGITLNYANQKPVIRVELKSACNKLDKNTIQIDIPKPNSKKKISAYRARKLYAIAITSHLLVHWNNDEEQMWSSLFNKSSMKEKDDLSDCLLQALTTYQTHDANTEKENIKAEKKKEKKLKKETKEKNKLKYNNLII